MKVRWKVLKRPRDWPPSEDLVLLTIRNEKDTEREVTASYWTEERENWAFKEWYPHHEAVAWTKLPPPFKDGK
jgi:hypothetical protein